MSFRNSSSGTIYISLLFLGTFASTLSYNSTMEMAEMNLTETAGLSAQRVAWEIQAYANIASELGMIERMSDESVPVEDKIEILNNHTEKYGLHHCGIVAERTGKRPQEKQ